MHSEDRTRARGASNKKRSAHAVGVCVRAPRLEVETVAAFAGLRRLWVRGYKPSLLDEEARSTTMEVLRRRGSMVVAKLVAYTATIEVVMPGELIPLEDVSIEAAVAVASERACDSEGHRAHPIQRARRLDTSTAGRRAVSWTIRGRRPP